MIICKHCSSEVSKAHQFCQVCNSHVGYLNVMSASREDECFALDARYEQAYLLFKGNYSTLKDFENVVSESHAVMNRSLSVLFSWLQSSNPLFLSFYKQVDTLGRPSIDNVWDDNRPAAESAINPYCYKDISYAALTTNDLGIFYYGAYSIVLKDITIQHRATVFEKNVFFFTKEHQIFAGLPVPLGYRATWASRSKLAVAKLSEKVEAASANNRYADCMIGDQGDGPATDFIEVHILGAINREGIGKISGPIPASDTDKMFWSYIKECAAQMKITLQEV